MRRKVTKQMLAAGLTVIMLFSALFPVNAFALGGQGNMAGIEGTVPAGCAGVLCLSSESEGAGGLCADICP